LKRAAPAPIDDAWSMTVQRQDQARQELLAIPHRFRHASGSDAEIAIARLRSASGSSDAPSVVGWQAILARLILPLSLSWDHRSSMAPARRRFNAHLAQLLADFRSWL